ncbi:MAG: class I SAM-dependent methyltransferase [Nitrospirota bacterium]|nr:class I SAM-dependent methyltransferase [Nitrospirota bacterium]
MFNKTTKIEYSEHGEIAARQKKLLSWINPQELTGLEIGPFDRPIVDRKMGQVKYLDFFSESEIREKYAHTPERVMENIVSLDYVIKSGKFRDVINERFDYIVASHVIEHVPNMLGWLRSLEEILNPSGRVFLVVPDRRFTFDIDRPATSLGEIIENDYLNRERPSPRSAFDQYYYHRQVRAHDAWVNPDMAKQVVKTHTMEQNLSFFERSKTEYIDCHCNVFSGDEFVEIVDQTRALNLHGLSIEQVGYTEKYTLEFYSLLRRGG